MDTHAIMRERAGGRESGAILAIVLVIMVLVGLLSAGLLRLGAAAGFETGRSAANLKAFWAAEAGVEHARSILMKRRRPANQIFYGGQPMLGSNRVSGTTMQGNYSVDVVDDPAWTNSAHALKKYIIRSRGTSGPFTQVVTLRAEVLNYASFMHASNFERNSSGLIYFGPADVIDGMVYVNDRLNLLGVLPRFLAQVRSTSNSVNYASGANAAAFEGGLTLNAPPLDISGQFTSDPVQDIKADADAAGLSITGDYEFMFFSDGSFRYRPYGGGVTNFGTLASLNGAIYVNGNVWVDGAVKGEVTIAAQNSIFITNHIVYATATNPSPWSAGFNPYAVTDKLGLIASNQVRIVTTNTVNIHSAIFVSADGGGFNAQSYNVVIGNPTPQINLFGSLTQYRRGVVGQSGTPQRGFAKNYKYDVRYLNDAPPGYPYSLYVFSAWRQGGG